MNSPKRLLRKAKDEDLRFIRSSWCINYWRTYARRGISPQVFFTRYWGVIDKLMCSGALVVSVFPEVPDEILGWSCIEGDFCHYTYVKSIYRRTGVASELLFSKPKWYTQQTNEIGKSFAEAVGMVFNPYY